MSLEDLAESIARQSRELWAHVAADEQPGDDDDILIRTDAEGRLIVAWGDDMFFLRDGRGWRRRPTPAGEEVSEYLDGTVVRRAVTSRPGLN